MGIQQIKKDLTDALKAMAAKTSAYDTDAEVVRVSNGTAWVHIPGGVDETPVALTVNAKAGDKVRVRVGNGTAFIMGNDTSPPTDDTAVRQAVDEFNAKWAKIGIAIIETLIANGVNADWINTGAFEISDNGTVVFKADATNKTLEWDLPYSSLDTYGQLRMRDGGDADDASIEISDSDDKLKTFLYANGVQLTFDRTALNTFYDNHMSSYGARISETEYVAGSNKQSYTECLLSLQPQSIEMIEDTYVNGSLNSRKTILKISGLTDTYELNEKSIATISTPTFTPANGVTVTQQTWSKVGNIVTGDLTLSSSSAISTTTVALGTLSEHPGHTVIANARTASVQMRASINSSGNIQINSPSSVAANTTIYLSLSFVTA